ncbi:segregation/condensation protein A [Domibacillus sp. PGB-M46]|uniref:segregation/condensation protein A n=1 Tax=Domibacillus sp. PGB-M46 TaxID=2910255 RepID=UPI001F57EEBA|nr:segregation/condensation protein A [Domibacillus sp. PGB-M46]MCI2254642.1 segregation/condensation protein A [Domibacillus sp. PGB-M46]
MEYKVKIDSFEGPLDLLLHLIQQLEIDIYDIPVSEITNQYLLYVNTMQQLELDVASEYLVMAATLIAMKSRSLLPDHSAEEEDYIEEEDPREELARRLIEYKKYKEAAGRLHELEEERTKLFSRPPADQLFSSNEEGPLNVSLFDMLGAFQKMARRKKLAVPPRATVRREELSVEKRMELLKEKLRLSKEPVLFDDLFDSHERNELVVSFLAILELMKQNEIVVSQEGNFADLYVTAGGNKG